MNAIRHIASVALLFATAASVHADIAAGLKALAAGDFVLAEKILRPEAERGSVQAQVTLGRLYHDSRNAARNSAEAYAWFVRAAESGNPDGQYWAGLLAQRGDGTPKDSARAVAWWRQAADAGHGAAMGMLASVLHLGVAVERDLVEAVRWARAGAAKHDAVSQWVLGRAYLLGQGVPRDVGQSLHWTRLAAMQGESNAQAALGQLYLTGVGVPQNYIRAHLWFNLAAARGQPKAARQRDDLAAKMTAEQLAEAQKLAAAWRPVRVTTAAKGGSQPSGPMTRTAAASGFVVDAAGNILTNHHVVRGCHEVRIPAHGVTARVSALDEQNDLALLESSVAAEELPTFRSSGRVRLGESIIVAGFPLGDVLSGGLNVTTGAVSALAGPRNNASMLQITAPVQSGNSGGPVLDQSGQVIGVVVSKLNALRIAAATGDVPQNVNFAIYGNVAVAFLEKNGVHVENTATTPVISETVDVAERARRYTVLVECWR